MYDLYERIQGYPKKFNTNGWTLQVNCGEGTVGPLKATTTNCITVYYIPGSSAYEGVAHVGNLWSFSMLKWSAQYSGTIWSGPQGQVWNKTDPSPTLPTMPGYDPAKFISPIGFSNPALNPEASPIVNPAGTPVPLPVDLVPGRQTDPLVDGLTSSQNWSATNGVPEAEVVMDTTVTIGPAGAPPKITIKPQDPTKRRPPGKGTKEKKTVLSAKHRATEWLINGVFESADILDAFWYALDFKYKKGWRGGATPQTKLEILYEHWDKVDMQKALDNLVMNELEDRLIGMLGKGFAKAARRNKAPHGYQTGPWDTFAMDLLRELRNAKKSGKIEDFTNADGIDIPFVVPWQ